MEMAKGTSVSSSMRVISSKNTIEADNAVASRSHLICWRCTSPDRMYRTTTDASARTRNKMNEPSNTVPSVLFSGSSIPGMPTGLSMEMPDIVYTFPEGRQKDDERERESGAPGHEAPAGRRRPAIREQERREDQGQAEKRKPVPEAYPHRHQIEQVLVAGQVDISVGGRPPRGQQPDGG